MVKNNNKSTILNNLAKEKTIYKILKSKQVNNASDLEQDILISLLEKPDELILNLYEQGTLINYIYKMIHNQVYSVTSSYHKTYRKPQIYEQITDDTRPYRYN